MLVHYGWLTGNTAAHPQAETALRQAVNLDSTYSPALEHLVLARTSEAQEGAHLLEGAEVLVHGPGYPAVRGLLAVRDVPREELLELPVRPRDDVHRDQLAHPPRGGGPGVGRRLHRADVAPHHHRDVAGADVLLADERHVRRFHHRVCGFDRADEPFRLDEPERFLWDRMDGQTSLQELGTAYVLRYGAFDFEIMSDEVRVFGDRFIRFGRVVDQRWEYYGGSPAVLDRYKYGYDRDSSCQWKQNVVSGSLGTPVPLDEYYTYDNLNRLATMKRGTLTGTPPNLTYTPNPNYFGSDTFTFTASDGVLQSAPAAISITVTSVNDAPMVSVTVAGGPFTAPATVAVSAVASDVDGTIAGVDFYDGATLIGTATSAPYQLSWSNVAAGPHSITAVATDDAGATTTTAAPGRSGSRR